MFFVIFLKILPLYLVILLGYIAGVTLKIDRSSIANFLLYIIAPIVILNGILNIDNLEKLLLLPVITFLISCCMCLIVYKATAVLFKDNLRNIIAFSSGSSSTGHFGLPLALMLLDEETTGIYILAFLGVTLFENTYGFYIAAKGNFGALYCIKKTLTLPSLHVIIIGMLMKALHLTFPIEFNDFFLNSRGAYLTLGMTTMGLALATIKKFEADWKCISITLVVKYILWPVLTIILILLDIYYFHIYERKVYHAMFILSIVPISISTMIVGSVLNYPAEKLAVVVLINTLAGLIYVPLIIQLLDFF